MSTQPSHLDDDHVESNQLARYRRWIIFWMLSALGGFVVGGFFGREYFNEQFLRIGWERAAMMMIAEVVALFWFARFLILHGILGRPLRVKRVKGGAHRKTWAWLMATLMLGAFVDGGVSVSKAINTAERYEQAERIEGTVIALTKTQDTRGHKSTYFDLVAEYEFDGLVYRFENRLTHDPALRAERIDMEIKPMWEYQPGLYEALKEGEPPLPIRMRVNRDNPYEVWVELGPFGDPPLDFPVLSIFFAFIQLMAAIMTLAFLGREYRIGRRDVVPWWLQPASFGALAFEGMVMYLFAFA